MDSNERFEQAKKLQEMIANGLQQDCKHAREGKPCPDIYKLCKADFEYQDVKQRLGRAGTFIATTVIAACEDYNPNGKELVKQLALIDTIIEHCRKTSEYTPNYHINTDPIGTEMIEQLSTMGHRMYAATCMSAGMVGLPPEELHDILRLMATAINRIVAVAEENGIATSGGSAQIFLTG